MRRASNSSVCFTLTCANRLTTSNRPRKRGQTPDKSGNRTSDVPGLQFSDKRVYQDLGDLVPSCRRSEGIPNGSLGTFPYTQ
jgi:hypothetical protein